MYADTSCFDPSPPARMQRAEGRVRVAFRQRAGATRLERLFQEGCAKVRLPKPEAGSAPEAILINTAGGLTGGDRLATAVHLSAGAAVALTTQACERVYRSTGAQARVATALRVEDGARLAWLPQETILFDGGRLSRSLEMDLEGEAEVLAVEAILFGRAAMGERVRSGTLHDRWRVRRDGRLIFADDFRVGGDIAALLERPAVLGGACAMATVFRSGSLPERELEPVRALVGEAGAASAWGGKLLVRLVAETGLALRRRLEPLLALLSGQALPRVWRI